MRIFISILITTFKSLGLVSFVTQPYWYDKLDFNQYFQMNCVTIQPQLRWGALFKLLSHNNARLSEPSVSDAVKELIQVVFLTFIFVRLSEPSLSI